jgi:hypothetical protein
MCGELLEKSEQERAETTSYITPTFKKLSK